MQKGVVCPNGRVFDLFAKISLDTSEYEKGLNDASKKFQNLGKKFTSTGKNLSKWVTTPVVGLGTAIIKTGADYEAGMSKVQAISGATGDEMDALGEKAMEMAAKTKFSTADTAQAYQYMAMAGWDAGQMVNGLSGIMNLAAASGEDLGLTSDIVTDALTAFGLTAADSSRFADVLAAASNSANTNVAMLGESFKYVAPVAGAMGFSVEDVSVALGLMANSGIKASQAGTSLRTAITNLASPTSTMVKVMEEYGISLTDADGNMLSFAEIMGVLRDRMGGLDEATQAAAASQLFGKEAMSGMLAIINAAPADFEKLTEAINNSTGTTEEMAAVMNDNAAGAMAMLSSAINVLFTNLSEFLIPAFTEIVRKITEVVNWFNQLDAGTQKLILTIAGFAAVIGPVLIVVGKIITAIGTIATGITGLIGGIGKLWALLMANPFAAVIAAIAAIAAGIIYLWNTNEDFRNAVGVIWDAITGFFVNAWETIKATWQGAAEFFGGIVDGIKSVFAGIGEFLGGLFKGAWEAVQTAWSKAVAFFTEIANGIKAVFEAVTEFLGSAFKAAWETVSGAWKAAKGFFSDIWDSISNGAKKAAETIGGALKKAWENIKSAWSAATSFFSGIVSDIIGAFSGIGSKFMDIGRNIVDGIRDGVSNAWNSFIGWLGSRVSGIVDAVKNMLGIHSPSTVFAGIGENMALGLAAGWDDQYSSIKRQIENGMTFEPATVGVKPYSVYGTSYNGQVGQGWQAGGGGDTFNFYSPKALDPVSAAREMRKAKQQMALGYV